MKATYKLAGDKALVMEFGNKIDPEINDKVRKMYLGITNKEIDGVEEVIPSYRSVLIIYNPLQISKNKLIDKLDFIKNNLENFQFEKPEIIEIPTVYGGEYGPDLEFVAEYNDLSKDEVIEIHNEKKYLVYMLGFTPGFVYVGGMSEKIATPRLDEPREKINKGSVGIAGSQTGIYPITSPGGWRLIGRTPLDLFDPYRDPPFLIKAGDYINFKKISKEKFKKIKKEKEENKERRVNNGKSIS